MRAKFFSILTGVLISCLLCSGCSDGAEGGISAEALDVGSGAGVSGETDAAVDVLTGSTADILSQILDDTDATLGGESPLPDVLTDPVTAENSPGMLGLLADDFAGYVTEATSATSSDSSAFTIALIKCNSMNDAVAVEGMIQNRFDSGKWSSVMPEQSLTSVSGSYVLLAVGGKIQTDTVVASFGRVANGTASNPSVFYTGETGGDISSDAGTNDGDALALG